MKSSAVTEIQVRFIDLDSYGHVNNSVYLSYMEIGRLPLVSEKFFEDMKKGIKYILYRSEIDYIKPIVFGDRVFVKAWLSEIIGIRFHISYSIENENQQSYAKGSTYHILFDSLKGKPIQLPEEWKNSINK